MKAYTQSRVVPGHGPRVFIPYLHRREVVVARLDRESLWGGWDKDTGKCWGWEMSTDNFDEVVSYLRGYGYAVEECSSANIDEVWGRLP